MFNMIVGICVGGVLLIVIYCVLKQRYGKYATTGGIKIFLLLGLILIGLGGFGFYRLMQMPSVESIGEEIKYSWLPELSQSCKLNKNLKVAVLPFKSNKKSEQLLGVVESILGKNVSIIERRELKKIHKEALYQVSSGFVDEKEAINVGRELGANYVVLGEVKFEWERIKFLNLRLVNVEKANFCGKSFTITCSLMNGCKRY